MDGEQDDLAPDLDVINGESWWQEKSRVEALAHGAVLRGGAAPSECCESHDDLRRYFQLFVDAYNHARRLKTLRGLSPYEHVCHDWTKEPDRRHAPGPNT